ncbi:hypothetical protein SAMN04515647_2362 [Cohaesibacter sp. ES.047]|nr:hypothetical protein SAMN04515647_2362 [Cohaesibacter sp. ES.047]
MSDRSIFRNLTFSLSGIAGVIGAILAGLGGIFITQGSPVLNGAIWAAIFFILFAVFLSILTLVDAQPPVREGVLKWIRKRDNIWVYSTLVRWFDRFFSGYISKAQMRAGLDAERRPSCSVPGFDGSDSF